MAYLCLIPTIVQNLSSPYDLIFIQAISETADYFKVPTANSIVQMMLNIVLLPPQKMKAAVAYLKTEADKKLAQKKSNTNQNLLLLISTLKNDLLREPKKVSFFKCSIEHTVYLQEFDKLLRKGLGVHPEIYKCLRRFKNH